MKRETIPVLSVEHTRRALAEYDRSTPARSQRWDRARTSEDVAAAEAADLEALRKVQEAFYRDTADRNCLENCYLVSLEFMRHMVETYKPEDR